MDLRQLQAFLAVVEHGGFTAAARATHTVQSNISTHVARLEKELDAVLIDRSTGKATEEGEAVVARARRIESELISIEADVSSLRGAPRGTVRLGIIGTTARWLAPLLIDRLARTSPGIRLVVADGTSSTLTRRLGDGELDMAVLALPVDDPDVQTTPLFDEDHEAIVPLRHPLAAASGVSTLAELARYELLLASPGTAFRREIDEAFRRQGLVPSAKVEVDGLRLLASLAFQGFGVAIVPATAAPGWIGGDWERIAVDGLNRRTVGLAVRRRGRLSAASQTTIDAATHVISAEVRNVPGLHLIQPSS